MGKRFDGRDQAATIENGDKFAFTAELDNIDYFGTISQLSVKVRSTIGVASDTLAGMMSAADKKKLDKYPDTTTANLRLVTDGSGNFAFIPRQAIEGDMLKSVYDILDDGVVNSARQADKISGATLLDQVYVTDGGNLQGFVDIATFVAGLATKIEGSPTENQTWGTPDGSTVQQFINTASLSVLSTQQIATNKVGSWKGTTSDAVLTEIFIGGVASSRFTIDVGEVYEFWIRSLHIQDDFSDYRIQAKRGIIANIAGVTQLLDTIKVIDASSEIDTTTNAVTSTIVADGANNSLKVSATGIAAENWSHKFIAIFNRINP